MSDGRTKRTRQSTCTLAMREEISRLRDQGATQRSLAERYNVSQASIYHWLMDPVEKERRAQKRRERSIKKSAWIKEKREQREAEKDPPIPPIPTYTYYHSVDAAIFPVPPLERSALWERLSIQEQAALRARVERGETIR